MSKKSQHAAAVAVNSGIAEKLEQVLTGPNDRAYIVCDFTDCKHLDGAGRCTIFTVFDVPAMKTRPCNRYEPRPKMEG